MFIPQQRRRHVAGEVARRFRREPPTKLDRVHALMRADATLSFKNARAMVGKEEKQQRG